MLQNPNQDNLPRTKEYGNEKLTCKSKGLDLARRPPALLSLYWVRTSAATLSKCCGSWGGRKSSNGDVAAGAEAGADVRLPVAPTPA